MISLSSCPVHYRETAGDHVIKFLSFERLFSRDAEEGALPPRLGAASVLVVPSSLDSPREEVLTTGRGCCSASVVPAFSAVIV